MTNLEYYKDEIKDVYARDRYLGDSISKVAKRHGYDIEGFVKEGKIIDWLLEEHKEKIKLKKWEKDLLKMCSPTGQFGEVYVANVMKTKGHFQGITDTSMTLGEILDNCEVVDR